MRGVRDEPGRVERGTEAGRVAAVEAGQLDVARARRGDRAERAVEVVRERVAERVELDREVDGLGHRAAGQRLDRPAEARFARGLETLSRPDLPGLGHC